MSEELKLMLFFNMVSGEIYQVYEDEVENLDDMQLPLKHRPSSGCKYCYGRMHTGFNTEVKIYQPCTRCVRKCVDFDRLRKEVVEVPTPKVVSLDGTKVE